jgi:hypothetical protein
MTWTAEFWRPIALKDGRMIATLAEARDLITTLPSLHQGAEHWQDADEMLSRAATAPSAVDDALAQLLRALKAEGLI